MEPILGLWFAGNCTLTGLFRLLTLFLGRVCNRNADVNRQGITDEPIKKGWGRLG